MNIDAFSQAVSGHAALRRLRRLQPAGGPGDKIFPPTYPGEGQGGPARHVYERRRIGDSEVWCVLLDSAQSQANRLEEVLLAAADDDSVSLPYVAVDFSDAGLAPLTRVTSLDAPHRVYDEILRDSLNGGTPFMKRAPGQRLAGAKPADATAVLELSPSALVFGAWHSQGEGGGVGAKFPRALVSEIVAIEVPVDVAGSGPRADQHEVRTTGRRAGLRTDPLGTLRDVEVYRDSSSSDWSTDPGELGNKAKRVRPSEINHGNILAPWEAIGITCAHAEHRATITLAGLRRLQFGSRDRNLAARALLASLGLLAILEQDARGYALRSRCDLVCDGIAPLELVHSDGSTEELELDRTAARTLYCEAYAQAEAAGFEFQSVTLTPQPKLIEIVRRSRELALEGRGEKREGGDEPRS